MDMSPTPEKIRALRLHALMTREEFGALVYAKERAVRAWEVDERKMSMCMWELLQIKIMGRSPNIPDGIKSIKN